MNYSKPLPENFKDGEIDSGTRIADGMTVYWHDPDVSANFSKDGQTLTFAFSKVLETPFCLSWSLNSDEIDSLKNDQIISFFVDELLNTRNNNIRGQFWSRLRYKKSRDSHDFWPPVQIYKNSYVAAKTLNEPGIQFHTAYDIEFSFFVEKNLSKQLKIVNPRIIIQDSLSL